MSFLYVWGMEVRLYFRIHVSTCIYRDTMTQVMSLPIKTVMEYKAHNISLKYETLDASSIIVYMWEQDLCILSTRIGLYSYRNTDVLYMYMYTYMMYIYYYIVHTCTCTLLLCLCHCMYAYVRNSSILILCFHRIHVHVHVYACIHDR